jgi:Suppressor of fused protein (SUFU)
MANVDFLQMIGLTEREFERLRERGKTRDTEALLDSMRRDNPMLIADLTRTKSYV